KSGAFMAAAANGCPAILRDGRNSNPLRDGEHFLASDDSDESVARVITLASNGELPRIAEAAHAWYHSHADWKVIAHRFQELIRSTVGKQSLIALPSQRPPWVVSPVTPSPTAS